LGGVVAALRATSALVPFSPQTQRTPAKRGARARRVALRAESVLECMSRRWGFFCVDADP